MQSEKKHFQDNLFCSGHTACAGCGQSMAAKLVLNVAGKNTIATNATGCLEVFSTKAPETAWGVPWLHSLFENSAAIASGVEAGLRYTGEIDKINVIAQGGDGGTADIGLQALSGMLERNHKVLYVCYDNEAYMNTGIQRSSLTPFDAHTTTSPKGKQSAGNPLPKKPLVEICAAHHISYAASASIAYPQDLQKKVKKALNAPGAKFLQVHVPCPLGWRFSPELTIEIARLAVQSGLYPLIEYENGRLVKVFKVPSPKPVEEYFKNQGRFRHLLKDSMELEKVQQIANTNIEYYGLGKK
jgi:pyruvate ferredoxin oxidoreductase beta subunit